MSAALNALTTLVTKIGSDDLAVLQPIADTYLTTVSQNTGLITDEAQSIAFVGQVTAALPQLEQIDVRDAALALKSLLDLEASAAQAALNLAPVVTDSPAASSLTTG